jgi:hypothetical protein
MNRLQPLLADHPNSSFIVVSVSITTVLGKRQNQLIMHPGRHFSRSRLSAGNERKKFPVRALRFLILALLVGWSAVGQDARGQLNRDITPEDRVVWSCYMICFPISRDYTGLFYDRPLDRPPEGDISPRLIDLQNAVKAGVDALSVDLFIFDKYAHPCFRELVDLIHAHKLPIRLSPMFDGFGRPGVTEEDVFRKVKEWFDLFADEDCVVRTGGKPVIWTFGASSMAPDAWWRVFSRLREAGCEGYWILDGGGALCLGPKPGFAKMAPWLDAFDGAYTFGPGRVPERPVLNAKLYEERYPSPGKTWMGSTKIGYWRPEIAVVTSPEGTANYRRSWEAIREADIRWVQQATWNDFSENHGIMPSANHSTTFVELTRALVRRWKGLPNDVKLPRLFLGRMREVQVGAEALYELLALLPDGIESATFELELFDGEGESVHRFPPRTLPGSGIATPHFQFPLAAIPAGKLLAPRAILRTPGHGEVVIEGEPTIVHRAGFYPERCYSWIYTPGHRHPPDVAMRLRVTEASAGEMALEATGPTPMIDFEILRNGLPVFVMRREKEGAFPSNSISHRARLPLNRRGRLDWGFYQARVTTADRRVAVGDPLFVEPPEGPADLVGYWSFDEGSDYRVLDSSPWMRDGRLGARTHYEAHQPARVPDPWGGQCVRFDGIDDRLQMDGPVVPPGPFTVECWMKPESSGWAGQDKSATIFASANADCAVALDPSGKLALGRKGDDGWVRIRGKIPASLEEWTHVAVTFDGTTISLFQDGGKVGSTRSPGTRRISRFGVGFNTVTRGSFVRGCVDDIRIHERVLSPGEFGPHSPIER